MAFQTNSGAEFSRGAFGPAVGVATGLRPDLADPHMLNRIGRYLANMDRVLVSCPPERRFAWAQVFKGAKIQGEVVDRQVMDLGAVGAVRGPGFGALVVSTGPLGLRARAARRGLDLVLTVPALIVLAPLLVLVALLIKLEDGGPIWEMDERYWLRHSLKPGLTGLAQIRGWRGATDTESDLANHLQSDLEYIDGWNVLRDLQIIFATVRVLVHDRAF